MSVVNPPLPIEPILPELARVLREAGSAVLQAPPGAGKTTLVPPALLDEPWLAGRKILVLEPRRLAARAAAHRMAELRGERVGATVGYRIRRESLVGDRTRIEVLTEGILARMLLEDPALEQAGVVVFDEFHERSLHADLGLALVLQSRALLRPDLRVLVMSATIEGAPVARLLGGAPIITCEGRSFPVETRYLPRRPESSLEHAVAGAVRRALSEDSGDILAFLPGQGEIHRTAELLESDRGAWSVHLLYGNLAQVDQDAALRPGPAGRRKVVLATSIAETSLTIEGVGVVVDAGLSRVPRYSPASGMTRLITVRVSRASADQRRGRAGRVGPGVCYRLWAAQEDHHLLARSTPEMLETDLTGLALVLAVAGTRDPGELSWLDPPPAAAFAEARELLRQLGALDASGAPTEHGRRMAELGAHPRLAHLLLRGAEQGAGLLAAQLAALLEDRDVLRGDGGRPDPDIGLRIELLGGRDLPPTYHGYTVNRGALLRAREEGRAWQRTLGNVTRIHGDREPLSIGALLSLAYPDRIGRRREGQAGRFLLRNGQGVFTDSPTLSRADLLVAAELDGDRRESRLWLGASLSEAELREHFSEQIEVKEIIEWDRDREAVVAAEREHLGAIVLAERPIRNPDPSQARAILLDWIRGSGLAVLPWTAEATQLRGRLAFVHQLLGPPWPDVSDEALRRSLDQWLGPMLGGVRGRADLDRIDLEAALLGGLPWKERRDLDLLAPTHLTMPTGSRIRVDYSDPVAPVLPVRLQEVFGTGETPRVGDGRVAVTLHLLSPAHRPVQVTRDLSGFWRSSYADVRKEMKGRYPKHYWPDDPLVAEPTRRAKPRGKGK